MRQWFSKIKVDATRQNIPNTLRSHSRFRFQPLDPPDTLHRPLLRYKVQLRFGTPLHVCTLHIEHRAYCSRSIPRIHSHRRLSPSVTYGTLTHVTSHVTAQILARPCVTPDSAGRCAQGGIEHLVIVGIDNRNSYMKRENVAICERFFTLAWPSRTIRSLTLAEKLKRKLKRNFGHNTIVNTISPLT